MARGAAQTSCRRLPAGAVASSRKTRRPDIAPGARSMGSLPFFGIRWTALAGFLDLAGRQIAKTNPPKKTRQRIGIDHSAACRCLDLPSPSPEPAKGAQMSDGLPRPFACPHQFLTASRALEIHRSALWPGLLGFEFHRLCTRARGLCASCTLRSCTAAMQLAPGALILRR